MMPDDIKLPEPVAYCLGAPHLADSADLYLASQYTPGGEHADDWTPLYTADQVRAAVEAELARRVPLTEEQLMSCLVESGCIGTVRMTYESGPYEVTAPSIRASLLAHAIEAAHGITETKGGSDA